MHWNAVNRTLAVADLDTPRSGRRLLTRGKPGVNSVGKLALDPDRAYLKQARTTEVVNRELGLLSILVRRGAISGQSHVKSGRAVYQIFHGTPDWNASHLLPAAPLINQHPPAVHTKNPTLRHHLILNEAAVILMPARHNSVLDVLFDRKVGSLLGVPSRSQALEAGIQALIADQGRTDRLYVSAINEFKENDRRIVRTLTRLTPSEVALVCGLVGPDDAPETARQTAALVEEGVAAFRKAADQDPRAGDAEDFVRAIERRM